MDFQIWLAFVAASIALLLIPGPTVLLVLSYAISQGKRVAIATVGGVALGDFIDRGRDADYSAPPAQIPACALTHGAPTLSFDDKSLIWPWMTDSGLGPVIAYKRGYL